ncbi:ead/Ea22-like family protein [Serratia fonticola]|uniref:ead/Ea22-like family protein n=1 Tax=Serratia fonticola TaxID=47917 RepID=UPI0034C5C0A5
MSDKLEALKAAALAATPGPWIKTEDDWRDSEDALITCNSRKGMTAIAKIDGGGEESGYSEPFKSEQQANAAFIAAANPAVVLDLLAALEEKDQRIKEFESITEGVDQLAIDGGWTARGMSEYAKSLETRNSELEQRTVKPIKLPKSEIGMACEFVSDHIVVSLAAVLVEAATAGFKAEVEGE